MCKGIPATVYINFHSFRWILFKSEMFGISWFIVIPCFVVSFTSCPLLTSTRFYPLTMGTGLARNPCNIRPHPWNWQDSCTLACLGSSVWMFHMSDLTKAEKCLENLSGRDESHAHHPLEEVGYGTSLSVFWKRAGRVPLLLFLGHIYLFYLMYITVIVWCLELTMTWLSSDHLKDFLR